LHTLPAASAQALGDNVFKSIVVGTDGSNTAAEAVTRAARLAAASEAKLHVVSAYPRASAASWGYAMGTAAVTADLGELEASVREHATSVLEQVKQRLSNDVAEIELHARPGDAADVILDIAEEQGADLIVVGNRGMTGARRFLLGSVPNKVAHHAMCDVLIASTT
jgi:nucleotide-binding universal stress UspA family protein